MEEIININDKIPDIITSAGNRRDIWLVTFIQTMNDRGDRTYVSNGRFFIANSLEEALSKFGAWANNHALATSQIYALNVYDVIQRQNNEQEFLDGDHEL